MTVHSSGPLTAHTLGGHFGPEMLTAPSPSPREPCT